MRFRVRLVPVALLSFLCALGVAVIEFRWLHQGAESGLLVALAGACVFPAVVSWTRRRFDVFEPVYPISVATFIYFGVMVVVVLSSGQFSLLGFDYRDQVPSAIFLALLALVSFYVTYYGPGVSQKSDSDGGHPRDAVFDRRSVRRHATILLALSCLMFVAWILVGGLPLWSLWIFGRASYGTWLAEAAGVRLGHLYAAQEALPACILLLVAARTKSRWPLYTLALLGAVSMLFAGFGARARLLLVFGSAAAFYYIERDKKPRLREIILIAFVVFFLIVGAIGHFRSLGNENVGPFRLSSSWDRFVGGADIVTTSALFVYWVPIHGYDWGRDFFQILLMPIPTGLWPDKYAFFGESPIDGYLPAGAAAAFFIGFFRSFGPIGVVVSMALAGWACRKVYVNYLAHPHGPFAQISVALLWAYLFHMYGRHSVALIVYGLTYVFAPVLVVRWLVARRRNEPVPEVEAKAF